MRLFGLAALRLFSRRASFLSSPLSRFFGPALRRPRRFASVFVGAALRVALGRDASFLLDTMSLHCGACVRFGLALRLALRRFASLFVGATLGVFGLAAPRLPLCRNASFLLGATRFLIGLTLPLCLRCRTRLFIGATLRFLGRTSLRLLFGLALPLRRGAGCQLGAVLGFFCLAVLRLPLGCSTGLALGASAARAHDDPNDRGCERKTNPADDEKHLHDWGSTPPFCTPTAGHLPL